MIMPSINNFLSLDKQNVCFTKFKTWALKIKNVCFIIAGVNEDQYDTLRFILYDSDVKKLHGQNATILAWIHTHVESNHCDFLSSIDVHNQRVLEQNFPHIQAIVVELYNTQYVDHKIYELTALGKKFCNKPGFHDECKNPKFYKEVSKDESGEIVADKIYDFSTGFNFPSSSVDYHYSTQPAAIEMQSEKLTHEENSEVSVEEEDETELNTLNKSSILDSGSNAQDSPNDFKADSEEQDVMDTTEPYSSEEELVASPGSSRKRTHTSDEDSNGLPLTKKTSISKPYTCDGCNKFIYEGGEIFTHLNKSKKCMKVFFNNNKIEDLKKLVETISGNEYITCISCKKVFSISQIKRHINLNKKPNCKQVYLLKKEWEPLERKCKIHNEKQKGDKNRKRQSEDIKKQNVKRKSEDIKTQNAKRKPEERKKENAKRKPENRKKEKRAKKTPEEIQKQNDKRNEKMALKMNDKLTQFKKFNEKQQSGLDYICVCCCTVRFRRSVQELTSELKAQFSKDLWNCLSLIDKFKFEGKYWIHHNCVNILRKGEMPNISYANSLWNSDIPDVFKQATMVEKLAIKKKIPFIKIRELPSSRMKFMKDKVINVAISDSDVLKSALTLPRGGDTLATVNVAVKRQMKSRSCYKGPELVRPKVINEMLKILTEKHKSYKNFPIKLLDETSKYKFITLPMVGEEDVDDKLLTLLQAFENLVPPILDSLQLKLGILESQDANSFLHAILDQCRYD